MNHKFILLLILSVLHFNTFCQNNLYGSKLFYQDQIYGGVAYTGFNIDIADLPQNEINLDIFIEPNSTIKKCFMFYSVLFDENDTNFASLNIQLNNYQPLLITTNNPISKSKWYWDFTYKTYNQYCIDVSQFLLPNSNNLNIKLEEQGFSKLPHFARFYFLIIYENTNLNLTNIAVYNHYGKLWVPLNYNLNNLNKINNNFETALSLTISNTGDNYDCYNVYVNTDSLGLVGWNDTQNPFTLPPAHSGTFYYQNNAIYRLNEDTVKTMMNESNSLANIQNNINNNSNNVTLDLIYHPGIDPFGLVIPTFPNGLSNTISNFVLAYTPACNATNINVAFTDTTICKGEAIHLQANGGVSYKWSPSTFLSDSTIANPICTTTKPMWYTCTITNADTCSKTIPVFVNVLDVPTITNTTTTPDTCGYNTGTLSVNAIGVEPLTYSFNGGTAQSNNTFSQLPQGNHNITVIDQNGCSATESVNIPATIITQANYTANPSIANPPAEVSFINQSEHYTNSIWYISDNNTYLTLDSFFVQNPNYTFQDTGVYNIMLISYNQSPACADTTYGIVQIAPPFSIHIPNVFTPNQDQTNDVFTIDIEGADGINCKIFNRWGNLVYETEQDISYQQQTLYLWDAINNNNLKVSDGTYFYVITVFTATHIKKSYSGTVQVFGE